MSTIAPNGPVEIANGVFWVGFNDQERNLHCNPYLIREGDEAVLLDGGSRTDFSTVMMNILKVGIHPGSITALIYHHYDPDLCSSIPNFEEIIGSGTLKLISHRENNVFIRYYSVSSKMYCIESMERKFRFRSGRQLQFIPTPYAHSAGSFTTFDPKTGTLFSSDLFGSYDVHWNLYAELDESCRTCTSEASCGVTDKKPCVLQGIYDFHRRVMPSCRALSHALEQFDGLPIERIAPQHGGIIRRPEDIRTVTRKLKALTRVGIDGCL